MLAANESRSVAELPAHGDGEIGPPLPSQEQRARAASPEAPEPLWSRNFALITGANGLFFAGNFMIWPVLPLYLVAMGGSEGQVGLVVGTGSICSILFRLTAGPAVDRWGSRPFLFAGSLMFLTATLLLLVARALPVFLVLRVLHGAGLAIFTTAASTFAANSIPRSRVAEGMGWYGLSGNVAMAVAPAMGGFLLLHASYTGAFLGASALTALCILAVSLIQSREPNRPGGRFRWIAVSRKAVFPSLLLSSVTFGFGGVLSFIPLRAAQVNLENVGLFYTLLAAAMITARITTGRWADRWSRRAVALPAMGMAVAAMLLVGYTHSAPALLAAALCLGTAMGSLVPSLAALAIDRAPATERGSAMATYFGAFDVGVGAGSILLGYLIEMGSFTVAYTAAAAVAACGLTSLLLEGRSQARKA